MEMGPPTHIFYQHKVIIPFQPARTRCVLGRGRGQKGGEGACKAFANQKRPFSSYCISFEGNYILEFSQAYDGMSSLTSVLPPFSPHPSLSSSLHCLQNSLYTSSITTCLSIHILWPCSGLSRQSCQAAQITKTTSCRVYKVYCLCVCVIFFLHLHQLFLHTTNCKVNRNCSNCLQDILCMSLHVHECP